MSRRRAVTELGLGLVFLGVLSAGAHLLVPFAVQHAYFGVPYGAVWSNLLASALCVAFAWWRLRVQALRQHEEQLAQKARHHAEVLAGQRAQGEAAAARHAELVALARRHHQEQLDRQDVHAAAAQAAKAPLASRMRKPGERL